MTRSLLGLSLLLLFFSRSPAAIVFDSGGFEAYNAGPSQLVGQFGWQDFNAPSGTRFSVQQAVTNGGSKAVSVSASSATAAFVAPAVNYTPSAGELVVIEVDIARTIATIPQLPSSAGFNVDVYPDAVAAQRTMGFGLGVNEANDTIVPFVTARNGTLEGQEFAITGLSVSALQFVNFRAVLNYGTQKFRVFVNGTDYLGELAFVNPASNLGDADLQHDSVVSSLPDSGYFDNYRISTMAVPEPGALGGCAFLLTGILLRRRRASNAE